MDICICLSMGFIIMLVVIHYFWFGLSYRLIWCSYMLSVVGLLQRYNFGWNFGDFQEISGIISASVKLRVLTSIRTIWYDFIGYTYIMVRFVRITDVFYQNKYLVSPYVRRGTFHT